MSIRHPSQQILSDLEELFPQVASDLRCWEGKNLLITGGTGFFGKWLLEALHFVREKGKLKDFSFYPNLMARVSLLDALPLWGRTYLFGSILRFEILLQIFWMMRRF